MNRIIFFLFCSAFSLSLTAQKKVILEKFTNAFCGQCPDASLTIKDIVEQNPNTIWVSHYKTVDWTEVALANPQSWEVWQEFGIFGNPLGMVDRKSINNDVILRQNEWEREVLKRLELPYYANIFIDGLTYEGDTQELSFDVRVQFDEIPSFDGPFRLTVLILEDEVWGTQQNSYYNNVAGHPLEGKGDIIWAYPHPNVVRDILENPLGLEGVIPDEPMEGEIYSKSFTYTISNEKDHRPDYYKVVAFIARHDENDINNREILNANEVTLSEAQIGTSTDDILNGNDHLVLYPNPVVDYIILDSDGLINQYSINDMSGNLVLKGMSENVINVKHLPKGTYVISIQSEGITTTRKFQKI